MMADDTRPPPASDPLPATSKSTANASVPDLDLAHDTSTDGSEDTPPSSPTLSRSVSHTSQYSTSSGPAEDEWESFPPLDKLTIFDFLDQLALPQRLEKLNRSVLVQRENLKRQRDRVRQQYVKQKERVLKKTDVEVQKYKQKYGEGLDKVFEKWNDTRIVSTREKIAFVIGVTNVFVTGYLMGGHPEWMYVWYSVQFLYFMPIRYYTYHKRGYHYFLADLCYFTNVLLMLALWVFPNSRRLMISTYCLSYGNNAWAIAMWRNSMVFHSLDKVTSLFIHIMPPLVFHTLVHSMDPAYVDVRFPAVSRVKTVERYGLKEMVIWATVPYALWQLSYHFLITVRRRDKIAAGRPTSFTWLRKSYAKSWVGRIMERLPEKFQEPMFMFIQYTYAVVTMLPCPFWFYHRSWSAMFISAVGLWSIYNGATYYIDVFGKRFQKELEQLKQDVAKWQNSPLPPSPIACPKDAKSDDLQRVRTNSVDKLPQLDGQPLVQTGSMEGYHVQLITPRDKGADSVGVSAESDVHVWEPTSFFNPNCDWLAEGKHPFALLILNQAIANPDLLRIVWSKASLHVCADGGANQLHDALNPSEKADFIPDCVVGDMDSIRNDVKEFYEKRGAQVIHNPDQDSTDFGKCLEWMDDHDRRSGSTLPVVVLGGLGGRVDSSFHSVHTLYAIRKGEDKDSSRRQIFLLSKENITFLLEPGRNTIHTPRSVLGPTCGLIPLGGPAILKTKGLEWDLDARETKIGGLLSTSNHLQADTVVVETDKPVLFTVEAR